MKANPKLRQVVGFALDPSKTGIVTAVLRRCTGTAYGVTWTSDMAEKWHAKCELGPAKNGNAKIGFVK